MLQCVCVLHDSAVGAYLQPFFVPSRGAAERGMIDLVNDSQSNVHKHPGDFTLFEIGTWDEKKGVITLHEAKVSYGSALDYVKK